jgi:predicted 3-demethylubiquinone-9 3-methyltransferase (glyoxalase superfamily)
VAPTALPKLLADPDTEKAQRVMAALHEMGRIDIEALERAAEPAPA